MENNAKNIVSRDLKGSLLCLPTLPKNLVYLDGPTQQEQKTQDEMEMADFESWIYSIYGDINVSFDKISEKPYHYLPRVDTQIDRPAIGQTVDKLPDTLKHLEEPMKNHINPWYSGGFYDENESPESRKLLFYPD